MTREVGHKDPMCSTNNDKNITKKPKTTDESTETDQVEELSRSIIRVGWLVSCIIVVLIIAGVVLVIYFVAIRSNNDNRSQQQKSTIMPSTTTSDNPTILTPPWTLSKMPSLAPTVSHFPTTSERPSTSIGPTGEMDQPGYFQRIQRPIRIACAGDSLTWGRSGGALASHSYPFQLQQMLNDEEEEHHHLFEVFNFGRNAMTALRNLSVSYVDTEQFQESLNVKPDIYLLMLGTNDVIYWELHGHKFFKDMEWIVNKVRSTIMESSSSSSPPPRIIVAIPPWVKKDGAFGVRNVILVGGVQPAIEYLVHNQQQKQQDQNHLQLVNMYNVTYNQTDSFLEDGLHLNEMGYRSLATAWRLAIQCNQNGICEVGENCTTCPGDCYLNCS